MSHKLVVTIEDSKEPPVFYQRMMYYKPYTALQPYFADSIDFSRMVKFSESSKSLICASKTSESCEYDLLYIMPAG